MKVIVIVENDGNHDGAQVEWRCGNNAGQLPVFMATEAVIDAAMNINDRLLDRVYNINNAAGITDPSDIDNVAALESIVVKDLPGLTGAGPVPEPLNTNNYE